MDTLTGEALDHHVATRVAVSWGRRGVHWYSFDDLYQDARAAIIIARSKFNPAMMPHGKLSTFLYVAAYRETQKRLTRSRAPVSSRSNGNLRKLGETQSVSEDAVIEHADESSTIDEKLYAAKVRERALAVAEKMPEGVVLLGVIMGEVDVAELADTREAKMKVYQKAHKLQKALQRDRKLYTIAKEGRSK